MNSKILNVEQETTIINEYQENEFCNISSLAKKYKVSQGVIQKLFKNHQIQINRRVINARRKYSLNENYIGD